MNKTLQIGSDKTPNRTPGKVSSLDSLARLALRYAGDDGNTVNGTAEAMAFMDKVSRLQPGDKLKLPKAAHYYLEVTA